MYDLRILIIWLVLGFLLYLIAIRNEKSVDDEIEKSDQPDSENRSRINRNYYLSRQEIEMVSKLEETDFIEKFDLALYDPDMSKDEVIPKDLIYELGIIPLSSDKGTLTVAMLDPFDFYALDLVREITGKRIKPVKIMKKDFVSMMQNTVK